MSKDILSILGRDIPLGKSAILEMEVAKLHTRNSINVPVIIKRGKKPGPTILLLAGVHGDEVNGVAIVRKIIKLKYNNPQRGTIICIPVFNVFGFLNLSRAFPDGRDLNRVFPGSAKGSLASQFAYNFVKEIAPLVDYVIDYHTGGMERVNVPQIRCDAKNEKLIELAKVFNAPFVLNSNYIPKSLRFTLNKMGKIPILFEGGKSNEIDEEVINSGVEGTLNVLKHLDFIDGELNEESSSVFIEKSKWIRAPYSGLFHCIIKNGDFVNAKDVLGSISDPYGSFERKVKASFDGYIFGLNNSPLVNKGDALFHISTKTKTNF